MYYERTSNSKTMLFRINQIAIFLVSYLRIGTL